jgi:hypothetical protein
MDTIGFINLLTSVHPESVCCCEMYRDLKEALRLKGMYNGE